MMTYTMREYRDYTAKCAYCSSPVAKEFVIRNKVLFKTTERTTRVCEQHYFYEIEALKQEHAVCENSAPLAVPLSAQPVLSAGKEEVKEYLLLLLDKENNERTILTTREKDFRQRIKTMVQTW